MVIFTLWPGDLMLVLGAWVGEVAVDPGVEEPVTAPLAAAVFIPSSNLMSRMLVGSSSILMSTNIRHSGHLSSFFVPIISSRHLRQNVCWHGNTLLVPSRRSKHTEHSKSSFSDVSSIILKYS